jgi:AcrR family transcriptional regulator
MTTTVAPPPGARPADGGPSEREARRAEIAAAACAVLAERGLAGTSMRHIAKAAGCSLGTLPHYFKDKDEVLLHAHRHSYEATAKRFAGRAAPPAGLQALTALLEDSLPLDDARRAEWKVWLTFWGHASYSRRVAASHHRRYVLWRRTIADNVRAAQARAEIDPGIDPEREAESLMAFVDGLALQAMLEPQVFPAERQLLLLSAHLGRLRAGFSATGVEP